MRAAQFSLHMSGLWSRRAFFGVQELGGKGVSADGGESASAALASGEDANTEVAVALSAPAQDDVPLGSTVPPPGGLDLSFGAVTV